MIARSSVEIQPRSWTDELRVAYQNPHELLADLGLNAAQVDLGADGGFAFRVPRPFAARMRPRSPRDPLLLQVIPRRAETDSGAHGDLDPVGDRRAQRTPALLQKYLARALLIASGACAINCRYCFRRHFPYAETTGPQQLNDACDALAADNNIREVILSGGDPLFLSDERIAVLVSRLSAIPHLRRLRIHTRLPITIPARITAALISTLVETRLKTSIVFHVNHPREIDDALAEKFAQCARAGMQLLNQSVLLRDINDSATTMIALSEALYDASVLPYYVHLLDPVQGALHFDVDTTRAQVIADTMRTALPGYLVPRFVREIPGETAKITVA